MTVPHVNISPVLSDRLQNLHPDQDHFPLENVISPVVVEVDQDHINNVVRMRRRMFLNLPHRYATPIGTDKDLARHHHPHHATLAHALFAVVEIEVSVRIQVPIANLAYKMI